MPIFLCIETSAAYCSVCISQGTNIRAEKNADAPFSHASNITLFVEECLAEARVSWEEVQAIVVSMGPGSYTGLRIGLSAAKGMAYALDKPIIGVPTLQALAYQIRQLRATASIIIPIIDARRMEVYTAVYNQNGELLEATTAKIIDEKSYSEWRVEGQTIAIGGNATEKVAAVVQGSDLEYQAIRSKAAHLVTPALEKWKSKDFEDLAYSVPIYVKNPNITQPKPNVLQKNTNSKNL